MDEDNARDFVPETQGGWPRRIGDQAALTGILVVLKSGISWEMLPQEIQEIGCGSGMTCWRRLQDWQRADVWQRLHRVLVPAIALVGQAPRTTVQASHQAACWQVLRLPALPPGVAGAGYRPTHRTSGHRVERAHRAVSLPWWSAPFRGSTASGSSRCATSAAPTSIRRSSPSGAPSSAGGPSPTRRRKSWTRRS